MRQIELCPLAVYYPNAGCWSLLVIAGFAFLIVLCNWLKQESDVDWSPNVRLRPFYNTFFFSVQKTQAEFCSTFYKQQAKWRTCTCTFEAFGFYGSEKGKKADAMFHLLYRILIIIIIMVIFASFCSFCKEICIMKSDWAACCICKMSAPLIHIPFPRISYTFSFPSKRLCFWGFLFQYAFEIFINCCSSKNTNVVIFENCQRKKKINKINECRERKKFPTRWRFS